MFVARFFLMVIVAFMGLSGTKANAQESPQDLRPRVIVTTDGEADDRCSMVRFLLTCNEFQVEGIINSSSQFHWVGGEGWNQFHDVQWVPQQIERYARVHKNLLLHDSRYPSPEELLSKWKIGNIRGIGEYAERTEGARWIASVLLDQDNSNPVWIQAWGGCNTIARALKIIQEDHPDRMEEVAGKLRLFLIWEQDPTYQEYIRPHWEQYNIPTIISDQFDCMAYIWPKVLPETIQKYFVADWMKTHILEGHGPLCGAYEAQNGAFHAEGDTPAFLHAIPTGLRSTESPGWGGWGGRYVKIRNNVWLDPSPRSEWRHPEGRWTIDNSWSKKLENVSSLEDQQIRTQYFKPIWRWLDDVQNDFAARADWCVKDFDSANHHPEVRLSTTELNRTGRPQDTILLDATPSRDPDGDRLHIRWWHYQEAGTYRGETLGETEGPVRRIQLPADMESGETIHMICEVTDDGSPALTRYLRVVITARTL